MAVAFVQSAAAKVELYAAASVGCSFAAPVAEDALICVFIHTAATVNVSSVTDTLGNSYTQAGTYVGGAGRMSLWYKINSPAGSPTITVTLASSTYFSVWAGEYGPVTALNDTSSSSGTSTAPTTTSVTVNAAGDLVVASYGGISDSNQITAPSSPFVHRYQYAVGDSPRLATLGVWGSIADDVDAPASEACSWVLWDSVAWVAFGASFTAATSPPPPPPPPSVQGPFAYGPAMPGSPWFIPIGYNTNPVVPPPIPPPPTPPIPPSPPPPPGSPPPPPTVPPSNGSEVLSLPREPELDPRVRRHLEQNADIWNSLFRTQQVVPVRVADGHIEYVIIATYAHGLTGGYGTPP